MRSSKSAETALELEVLIEISTENGILCGSFNHYKRHTWQPTNVLNPGHIAILMKNRIWYGEFFFEKST